MTLTQSGFARAQPVTTSSNSDGQSSSRQPPPPTEQPGILEEFLAALPEDIRREVLEEHSKTTRTQQRSNVTTSTLQKVIQPQLPGPPPAERRLRLPPLPEKPTFTSRRLSDVSELRDAVESWHAAFTTDGPFGEDVTSLSRYLKRVILEEKDVDKAVSVINWLIWLVDDAREFPGKKQTTPEIPASPRGAVTWDDAVRSLREDINAAVQERGLPPVEFG